MQSGCQGNGGSIAAATAQGGDIIRTVQSLETSYNYHAVAGQLTFHTLGVQALNAGFGVSAVGVEAGLPAGQADGRNTDFLQRHGQQRDGNLLAGGQQHIHFAVGRITGDLGRFGNQVIGGIPLGRNNNNNIVALVAGVGHNARNIKDAVTILDRGTAELLYDKTHKDLFLPVPLFHRCACVIGQQAVNGKML